MSTVYRILHPMTAEYPWNFSSTHGTFTKTDHILSHKTHLNKFKTIKIIQSAFCNHNGPKLEMTKMTTGKLHNTWRGVGGDTFQQSMGHRGNLKEKFNIHRYIKMNENKNTCQNL